ncbi:unnamed protein product [marine sediment metagenome]|uniref:Uncharacterized protein n=1 Tax=marine sediment metagenome TaxID=412755 RepID=X0V6I9_9ZZZZ
MVLFVTVITSVGYVAVWYPLMRDTDSVINRAQVAADREDMVLYMEQLKENMEKYGMTEGHIALVFKTPITDMELHYKAVKRILDRLESIKEIGKDQTAYQVALDDLRGVIRELPNPASGWAWVHYGWWILLFNGILWSILTIKGIKTFAEEMKI